MSTEDSQDRQQTVDVVKRNWRAEIDSAQAYRDLATREPDEKRRAILVRMAEAEERHAQRWAKKLVDLGEPIPTIPDSLGTRIKRWFNRAAGPEVTIRRMEAAEDRHEAEFRHQRDNVLAGEADVRDFLQESALEEKAHARMLNTLTAQLGPRTTLDAILKRERWHGRGGSWVADAIYGVNDGLGAVFGIVSGVAGATNNQQHYILISGLAGMMASSLSMGAGAYLAVKSEAEVYQAEIAREKAEVEENPEEEIEEMSLFISSRDSVRRKRNGWPNGWAKIRSNSFKRWPRASSVFRSIVSLRLGNRPPLLQSRPPSARSSRSFRFSS